MDKNRLGIVCTPFYSTCNETSPAEHQDVVKTSLSSGCMHTSCTLVPKTHCAASVTRNGSRTAQTAAFFTTDEDTPKPPHSGTHTPRHCWSRRPQRWLSTSILKLTLSTLTPRQSQFQNSRCTRHPVSAVVPPVTVSPLTEPHCIFLRTARRQKFDDEPCEHLPMSAQKQRRWLTVMKR